MPIAVPSLAWLLLVLLSAYALGGVSAGWWLVRQAGSGDLRDQGSGTTGATNAGRVLGGRGFLLVLLLDAAKGAVAMIGARWLGPNTPWVDLALPAAVAGHIWPVWLRFRGGRGAATLLGGSLVLHPSLPLLGLVPGLALVALTRNRFLGGAAAFAATLVLMWWTLSTAPQRISYLLASGLVLLAHRGYLIKYWAP